jgi:hypothetical protein
VANLYGVANAPSVPILLNSGNFVGSTTCTHDIFTLVGTTPALVAPSAGYFYALVCVTFQLGTLTSVPTGNTLGLAIGAGSFTNAIGVGANFMAPSAAYCMTMCTFTPTSQVAWQGAGSVVNIGFQPGVNNCTWIANATGIVVLMRAPDQ